MKFLWAWLAIILALGCARAPQPKPTPRTPEARLSLKEQTSRYPTDTTVYRNGHLVFLGQLEGKQRALEFFVTTESDLQKCVGKTLLIEARAPDGDAHSYIRFPIEGQEVLLVRGGVLTFMKIEEDWLEVDLVLDCEKGPIEGTLKSPFKREVKGTQDAGKDSQPKPDRSSGD